ncbi:hypothetical protein K458DRAFT_383019 [Lentithecium fluviatile CBS 122367]|uniref:WSC domain-containing protein n=1 Tax=Lentithecium fluviatile CBS 122367 TaxID=1168545 RepID=A0A6G1JH54_9PLEO|nr:hypothetical protein K458DRAFT_383019 [Lentithecium fluviatile CBS 122367]
MRIPSTILLLSLLLLALGAPAPRPTHKKADDNDTGPKWSFFQEKYEEDCKQTWCGGEMNRRGKSTGNQAPANCATKCRFRCDPVLPMDFEEK